MSARAAKASKHEAGDSAPATAPEPDGDAHLKHKKAHTTHASSPTGGSAGLAVVAPAEDMEAAMAAPTPLQTSTDHVRRVQAADVGVTPTPQLAAPGDAGAGRFGAP